MIAYHFVSNTLRDGRPIPADSEWLEHDGQVKICSSGLHYSLHPFDALTYAPGATLCMVEIDGIIDQQSDKGVCTRRKIIKRINATELLRSFARQQALSVLHLWDAPQIVKDYLLTGAEDLQDAAGAAARAAVDAAWAAGAAVEAAWAAGAAAWAAVDAEDAEAAARAARAAARAVFAKMVSEAFENV